MKPLVFYFDFLSPFSYLAWKRFKHIKTGGRSWELAPVPLGPLLNHWGIKGPGEVEPKREFLLKTCMRRAARDGVPFTTPKTHPFNSLYALRLALKETAGDQQEDVIAALWKAGWETGVDMGDPDVLQQVLREAGLPAEALFEKSFSAEARAGLKQNLARALELKAFGVPSFDKDGELFWGDDSLGDLEGSLLGLDTIDHARLTHLLNSTPRAAGQILVRSP